VSNQSEDAIDLLSISYITGKRKRTIDMPDSGAGRLGAVGIA